MANNSKIEWTEDTWNPIAGCSVVSPGCANCYAMRRVAPRLSGNPATPHYHGTVQNSKAGPVWTGKIGIASDAVLLKPLRRRKPTLWFVNSTSDLFHEDVPDAVIDRIIAVMAMTPQHTYQVLTKRSKRMREYMTDPETPQRISDAAANIAMSSAGFGQSKRILLPLPNVWLGISAEDQTRADERIPDLLATPAAIRFVSAEPLLGPVDLMTIKRKAPLGSMSALPCETGGAYLDWIIVGGESGNGARPMHPDWARDIRDQCAAANVPFFFKQWGEWADADHWLGLIEQGPALIFVDNERWHPARPLNYSDAERLACLTGCMRNGQAMIEQNSDGTTMIQVGKARAGRLLDGKLHDAMPKVLP